MEQESMVRRALDSMAAAWDAGDARAYARCFAPDATYVIYAGSVSVGREAIERDHKPVLERFQKGSRMRIDVRSVRILADDLALVVTDGGIAKRGTIPLDKVQTFVFRRQPDDGEWLCEAFQNTKKHRLMLWLASRGAG